MFLVFFACLTALPFFWMVTASFKPLEETEGLHFVPKKWDTGSYAAIFRGKSPAGTSEGQLNLNFGKWYFNSLLVAGWVTFLQLATSSMAAYAFSRVSWPGRDKVFLLYLGTMMIPSLVLIIPNYFLMVKFHLVNSYLGLILPAAFSAFGTFLLRQFMMTIPLNLEEAAKIDGAGHWRIFTDIILPQSRPGLITLAIFCFIGNYGSFFWPLIMIKDESLWTLPIGMLFFNTDYGRQTNLLMAASLLNLLPPIIIFIALQKFLARGIQIANH